MSDKLAAVAALTEMIQHVIADADRDTARAAIVIAFIELLIDADPREIERVTQKIAAIAQAKRRRAMS